MRWFVLVAASTLSAPPSDRLPVAVAHPDFEVLYRQNFGRVVRWARAFGVLAGEAEDVAQQVFLIAGRAIEDGATPSRGWLFQIARRACANHRRGRARARAREHAAPTPATVPAPDAVTDRARAAALLERFLDSLPEQQRLCFVLYDVDGLRAPEVAELLSLDPQRVHTVVRLVRGKLERVVARQRAADGQRRGKGGAP